MMNDLAYVSAFSRLPLVTIAFEDILDADETVDDAAVTQTWRPEPDAAVTGQWQVPTVDVGNDPDAADTLVMPVAQDLGLKRYLSANGLPFRTSVALSMTLLVGILAALVAACV